jgi:hypothetical protein
MKLIKMADKMTDKMTDLFSKNPFSTDNGYASTVKEEN